jgi:hypothetical protein
VDVVVTTPTNAMAAALIVVKPLNGYHTTESKTVVVASLFSCLQTTLQYKVASFAIHFKPDVVMQK